MRAVLPLLASLAALGFGGGSATAPSPCLASNFTVGSTGPISEPTGQHTLTFRFRYHGSRPCSLYGYPSVAFYDRRGKIPFGISHRGDQVVTSRKPTRVVVGPRKAAFVVVNKYRCDLPEVRTALALRLGFPRATPRQRFAIAVRPRGWIAYCGPGDPGSGVTVSPFEPSLALAMRG